MEIVWFIAFLIFVFGFLPYGYWMACNAIKKRWKRLGLQILIPIAIYLLLLGISAVRDISADERRAEEYAAYLEGLYDTRVDLGDPIFEYDPEREFMGDGYSIFVYELPPEIRTRFESADNRLLSNFPRRSEFREDWHLEHWKRSPVREEFGKHVDFALSNYNPDREDSLSKHSKAIREALLRDGAYYAFFYDNHGDYVYNIDFFVVDLVGNRLYSINHNT